MEDFDLKDALTKLFASKDAQTRSQGSDMEWEVV